MEQQSPDKLSTTTSQFLVTNTKPSVTSRYSINTDAKAVQLRNLIVKTQTQISDTQRRLDETCKQLNMKSENRLTQQSSSSGELVENSPASSASLSSVGPDCHHGHEDTVKRAQVIVRTHIKQLTRYNELKDLSMVLLGMIAEAEGKRVQEVMEERGVKRDAS